MVTWLFTVLVFVAAMTLVAVIFFFWLIASIVRLGAGGLKALFNVEPAKRLHAAATINNVRCDQRGCQTLNPPTARFCRRCGRGMPAALRVQVRRAAVW